MAKAPIGRRPAAPGKGNAARQVAAVLDEDSWLTVSDMAQVLERSKADVARDLIAQGILALQAAAAAERGGKDVTAAVVKAMRKANPPQGEDDPDVRATLAVLDAHEHLLKRVYKVDPEKAIMLASGSASALREWADHRSVAIKPPAKG